MVQKQNAKGYPEFYTCNFLTPGLVSYEDVGAGIAWLSKETIINMLPSFQGKPVVIDHIDVTEKSYTDHAVGYITRVWFDDMQGWAMCNFILIDDKAKDKISKGYSVSCAYDQVVTDPTGGEKNAIHYHEEIMSGVGNHLALVTSPRYEEAKITPLNCMMLVNSKRAAIQKEESSVTVTNATKGSTETQPMVEVNVTRICNDCEYLVQGMCQVAGPGGEITQRYADLRLHGEAEDCSAYDKAEGRRENFVVVKTVNK